MGENFSLRKALMDLTDTLISDLASAGISPEDWRRDVAVDPAAVQEVMQLFNLPEEEIRDVLARHDSNVDQAMSELFERYSNAQEARKETQRAQQLSHTTEVLQRGFAGIDKGVIEAIVNKHNGDMELASQELLAVMADQLARDGQEMLKQRTAQVEQKQAEQKRLRAQELEHCKAQFDVLTEDEVISVLRKTDYDLPASVKELRELSKNRKLRNLQFVFHGVSHDHIEAALEACEYDLAQAFALLSKGSKPDAPPVVAEEEVIQQSLAAAAVNPSNQAAQDMVAQMLRDNMGPGAGQNEAEQPDNIVVETQDAEKPSDSFKVVLSVASTYFRYGDSVEVAATVSGGDASSHDWLGLFAEGAKGTSNVLAWTWAKSPSLTFPSYGRFEVRYLRKVGGVVQELGRSQTLTCGPVLKTLNLSDEGDFWKVSWEHDENSEKIGSGAWFGLFDASKVDNDAEYFSFRYASAAAPDNTLSFKKRDTNGNFHVRFFAHRWQRMAVSNVIEVSVQDSVEMEKVGDQVIVKTRLASVDPKVNTKMWVAVCFANDTRAKKYRRYAYITAPHESFKFKAPIHTGLYEARIYNASCDLLCKSAELNIVGI